MQISIYICLLNKNISNLSQEINPNDWTVNDPWAKYDENLTFSMVAIVRIMLEITSLAGPAGDWPASLSRVEIVMILMMITIHICVV